jgi:DNA-binding IscR family transcriptional regulator
MREVRDAISDVLDRTTLADLLRKVESSRPARDSAELAQYEI